MAAASAPVGYWVGTPRRVEGELCPSCFLPSLVQVPYYQYLGEAGSLGDMLISGIGELEVKRRYICHAGCGWERTDEL